MQKKFTTNSRQFHSNAPRFAPEVAVTQPRFLGQPISDLQRPPPLLPDPVEVSAERHKNNNQTFVNRNKKLSNAAFLNPPSAAFRHKINIATHDSRISHKNPPFGNIRNKIAVPSQDIRINHKFDISRKAPQHTRLRKTDTFNKGLIMKPLITSIHMPPSVILSITNYPPYCNETTLIMFFAKIKGFIQLFNHRIKKHVSFVVYSSIEQATEAITAYNGLQLDHDHKLHVGYSNHEMPHCD